MLHSRCKAAIVESTPDVFHIYIRGDLLSETNLHTFYKAKLDFPTYQQAAAWYAKRYAQGEIITFENIRLP